MSVGIWLVAPAGDVLSGGPFLPGWVKAFDPDAFDGLGDVTVTTAAEQAQAFDDTDAALAFLQTPSVVRPTRSDGDPNRPLMAFTAEVRQL